MFIDKTIKFGYGSVLITSNEWNRIVEVTHIEPPKPIGKTIDDMFDVKVLHKIVFEYAHDMLEFYENLKQVSPGKPILEFRGYTFDFTNYHSESVRVVRDGFRRAIKGNMMLLAC